MAQVTFKGTPVHTHGELPAVGAKAPDFKRLLKDRPCPLVATFRRPADGGRFPGSEEERLMLLRQAIVAGFDWVAFGCDRFCA